LEDLPEALEPHSAHFTDTHTSWKTRFADHVMWVFSRGLLIVFIVVLAFVIRVPFHRLIQRDVVLDMEEAEKEKMLEKFRLVSDLSVLASNLENCFSDSAASVSEYARTPTVELRDSAEAKMHRCNSDRDRLIERWGDRHVKLDDEVETYVNDLLREANEGLKLESELLSGRLLPTLPITFEGYKLVIDHCVDNIAQYERNYVIKQRKQ